MTDLDFLREANTFETLAALAAHNAIVAPNDIQTWTSG